MARSKNGSMAALAGSVETLQAAFDQSVTAVQEAQATIAQHGPQLRQAAAALQALGQTVTLPDGIAMPAVPATRGRPRGSGRTAAGGPRKRPSNEMTLVETLGKVLKGKTMSVTDAATAVQSAGYKTGSSNFRTQVNIALIKSGAFKRTGRGVYTAK